MKTHARAVIVGGGIFGVSVLYHLVKEGWSDVVLIEKGELTSGSTWHAAAQCPHFIGSYNMGMIHNYTTELYPKLEAETGQATGWHGCGGIRLAYTDDEADWFHYVQGIGRQIGYESHIVGPNEISHLHPFLNTDGVKACYVTVTDGHCDPTGVTNALAIGATNGGAAIYRRNRVTDIQQLPSGEWQVVSEKGTITCDHVVNACGSYAVQVAAWSGLKLPIVNMLHQYVVTESLEQIKGLEKELPVVRDPHSSSYLRQEQKGLLIGPYETKNAKIVFEDGVPWDFDMELLPPDLDQIADELERAIERLPLFGEAGIKRTISGPITHLPDGGFLLGPAPGLRNHWLACGSSIGISQGGGAGKYLAQWMVHGQAEINMNEFDPRRYGDWACGNYADAKGIEEYEHMYSPHFPSEHRDGGRPVRATPLYEKLKAKGAVYAEVFGWERPKFFANGKPETYGYRRTDTFDRVALECEAVRQRVGIMDLSSFAKFEVGGPDTRAVLDHALANKLPARDGRIVLAHFLNDDGFVLGEATVTRLAEDRYYVLSGAGSETRDLDTLNQAASGKDVAIHNCSSERGMLVVAGPHARDVLRGLTQTSLANEDFRWMSGQDITMAGIPVRLLRVGYVGELSYELHCPIDELAKLYDAIYAAGEAYGIGDFGAYAMNSLRIEKAYRGYGAELTNEVNLIEAGMDRFIDWSKTFRGKAATEAARSATPKLQIAYLDIATDQADVNGNEPIRHNGDIVGIATSGGYGHATQKSLAFAYIKPELTTPGTELSIDIIGQAHNATVLADIAWDPQNERLRS